MLGGQFLGDGKTMRETQLMYYDLQTELAKHGLFIKPSSMHQVPILPRLMTYYNPARYTPLTSFSVRASHVITPLYVEINAYGT